MGSVPKQGPDDVEFTLWIDSKTVLPLKRVLVMKRDGVRITEIYTEFKLDPKVDTGLQTPVDSAKETGFNVAAGEEKVSGTCQEPFIAAHVMDKGVARTASPLDCLDEVTPAELAAAVSATRALTA